ELVGALLFRAYHTAQGDPRKTIIIPDSAHGTNPATVAMAGYDVVTLESNEAGRMDPAALEAALDEDVAGVMLTNPNTLGKFESDIERIADLVHEAGGLMYMDGANLNALMGIARPGDMGYDIVHFNLHKTFSTPHGGGGPGAGPVAVKERLARFLPVPAVLRDDEGRYALDWDRPDSIGKIHGFWGNFGVHARAYTYIRMLGREGVPATARAAVLNNAYVSARLVDTFPLPYGRGMHESVFSGSRLKKHDLRTLDLAKRLLDFGIHAPTVYFPLIVAEAIMTEPTETETKEELDR
ncbi:MAG: aminotransferase class V-fold PLP-dependent enzyme, partial [Gemmatimonadetes bacterium]|nr:aminotransferase class V-fold PLP-dependent enzyme [Gemmatimonadota bacterium]NIQ58727.1 aminotransferase class V-fold PLP-dependent enzyme [Gemmatimonadota bacterium]NIV58487.1 aminotransferase class V-fold PLP-dependent enzyme [Actinomycetota bacterium]NIX47677.1 aminotransferase class V-fold PLP-dependent enzyme [Gemmatimonadota bacterium]NIY12051.1 aminotransferase class V-fold PLP-dependent enzyme [Gemmatimonadota bacterium]